MTVLLPDPPVRPDGRCQCGCGQATTLAKVTNRRKGHVKGEPVRFINGHNARGVAKSPETLERMRNAWAGVPRPWLRGPRPRAWKNPLPEEPNAHQFMARHHPKSGLCERCGTEGKTDYAFLRHPEPYTRDPADYEQLCRSCHVSFDFAIGARGAKK